MADIMAPHKLNTAAPTMIVDIRLLDGNTSNSTTPFIDHHEHHDPPYWDLPVMAIYSITMLVFWVLAFFGNLMVLCVIIRHRSMRTRTNVFIGNLALADFFVSIFNMPFSLGTVLHGDWPFGDILCQVNGFFMPLLFICSQHTLMYLAIHKFLTVTFPFKRILTFQRVVVMICAAWIIPGTISTLALTGLNHIEYKKFTTQCGPSYPKDLLTYLHVILMTFFTYILPVSVMTFCYVKMFIEIRAHSGRLQQHTNQDRETIINQQKRALVTFLIVMAMFLLCWTPYTVYAISSSILKNKEAIPHNVNAFVYMCGYMNSSINPIIYGLRNKAFQDGYRELVCWRRMPRNQVSGCQLNGNGSIYRPTTRPLTRQLSGDESFNSTIRSSTSSGGGRRTLIAMRQDSLTPYIKQKLRSDGSITYTKSGKIVRIQYPRKDSQLTLKEEEDELEVSSTTTLHENVFDANSENENDPCAEPLQGNGGTHLDQ